MTDPCPLVLYERLRKAGASVTRARHAAGYQLAENQGLTFTAGVRAMTRLTSGGTLLLTSQHQQNLIEIQKRLSR